MAVNEPIFDEPSATELRRVRRNHFLILCGAGFVVLMSYLLVVLPNGHAAFRGFEERSLPGTCPAKSLLGYPCPGCGLTRGFVYFAQGEFRQSFAMNGAAWLLALVVWLQIPYRIGRLRRPHSSPLNKTFLRRFWWFVFFLLIVQWGYKLFFIT